MKLRRWPPSALAILAVFSTTVLGAPTVQPQVEPASAQDVVATLRQIVDERSFTHDDFYLQKELVRRFGSAPNIRLEAAEGVERRASVDGYENLSDVPPVRSGLHNGTFISFGKYLWPTATADRTLICYLEAEFRGFASGMDFDSIVARLGPGWRRNEKAEQHRFLAITSEPFNPAPALPTTRMGNAIIDYGQGNRQVELDFNESGVLYSVTSSRLPC